MRGLKIIPLKIIIFHRVTFEISLYALRTRDKRRPYLYTYWKMQYLFTCVNTSVPGSLAAKFEKYIGPENSRSERPAWHPLDPAYASILASSLVWRSHCASGSRLWSTRIETLKIEVWKRESQRHFNAFSIPSAFEYANWIAADWIYSAEGLSFRGSFTNYDFNSYNCFHSGFRFYLTIRSRN